MEKIFLIGGMGAGKSTVRKALVDLGVPCIDLDDIGHEVLEWQPVKDDLAAAFGPDVFDAQGNVNRGALAAKAFSSTGQTRKLNRITMPRIEDLMTMRLEEIEQSGAPAVVVEYSVFKNRESSLAVVADTVIAVIAPEEERIARAVASGFDEQDVRKRIAQQITDEERRGAADVVFENTGTPEELYEQVKNWWNGR